MKLKFYSAKEVKREGTTFDTAYDNLFEGEITINSNAGIRCILTNS